MLAAPTTPDERLERIVARSRGFVYAVGLLGVTGERDALAASATVIARRLKAVTDLPVLVGVGISTPAPGGARSARSPTASWSAPRWSAGRSRRGRSEAVAELVGTFRTALDRG